MRIVQSGDQLKDAVCNADPDAVRLDSCGRAGWCSRLPTELDHWSAIQVVSIDILSVDIVRIYLMKSACACPIYSSLSPILPNELHDSITMASTTPEAYKPLPVKDALNQVPFAEPLWHSRKVSPYYSESHRRLQKEVRQYVNENILPFCEQWERQGSVPGEVCLPTDWTSDPFINYSLGDRYLLNIADKATWPQQSTLCLLNT